MEAVLNQALGFDEVRWATTRKTSYDAMPAFAGMPQKTRLEPRTRLFRLLRMATGMYFDGVWWMPAQVFDELRAQTNRSQHGSGRLFRNYVAQALALPVGDVQLCVVEIELVKPVFAWVGKTAPLFERPGGVEQVFLPNLAEKGRPSASVVAKVNHTYWLKF